MNEQQLRAFFHVSAFAALGLVSVAYYLIGYWLGHFFGYGYQAAVLAFSYFAWSCFRDTDTLFAAIEQTTEEYVSELLADQ